MPGERVATLEARGLGRERSGPRHRLECVDRVHVARVGPASWPATFVPRPPVLPMSENSNQGRLRPLVSGVVLRSQTDARLCALARAGHQQAFGVIFERYRRELCSHAARIVRADRADDVVQQAMLGAWTTLTGGPPIFDLRPWLHRVVHNAALDTVARRGYDDAELPDSSTTLALTDELVEGRLAARAALAAMASLPQNQLRALTLTAIDGRSGRDAAATMGITDGAVRQLVHRARSGVRAAASAVTPLPLINWLVGAGGSATPAAVGLAGGGAATAAKVIAVIGVTATLGVTQPLLAHHSSRPARATPTGQATLATPDSGRPTVAVQQVAVVEAVKPVGRLGAPTSPAAGAQEGPAASGQQAGNAADGPGAAGDSHGGQGAPAPATEPSGDGGSAGKEDVPTPVAQVAGVAAAQPESQPSGPVASDQSRTDGSPPPEGDASTNNAN